MEEGGWERRRGLLGAFFFSFFSFLGWIFGRVLKFFVFVVFIFIWMVLVDAVNIDVVVCITFSFRI